MKHLKELPVIFLFALIILSCNTNKSPAKEDIAALQLKRGAIVSCGPLDAQFGKVEFEMSCDPKIKNDFNLAVELLHSFEYDEAEKAFAKVIDEAPGCAMAYWGIAMSNFHPLWTPPTQDELQKGAKAIAIATGIKNKTERETAYISAIASFYKDWNKTNHQTRCVYFEKVMEQLHNEYPADPEAAIFYALALDASASPGDKTYTNQKKAGNILNALYTKAPAHPGIIHYIIHTYDYPELATLALPAARKYEQVAPSSAHALHMPSHIFTRLGLWDDAIQSNSRSVEAAKCYAVQTKIPGHWDEELHGLDYLVYAYLQKANNKKAATELKYIDTIKTVYPVNFKIAYAFAAMPSRYVLENKNWKEAAVMDVPERNFSWNAFPWQEAIIHFTRLLGAVHTGKINDATAELEKLKQLKDALEKQKDAYKAKEVAIQIRTGEAWIAMKTGDKAKALQEMKLAADMEDSTGKHPVTPGEVIPARELLADMLLQLNQNKEALLEYEVVLKKSPNRFNSLYNAGVAAQKVGDHSKAAAYFKLLLSMVGEENVERREVIEARSFLKTR